MGKECPKEDITPKDVIKTYKEEVRTGYYEQKIIIIEGEKREQLTRYPKSLDKVSFGFVGNMEYFSYPYKFPDKVFASVHGSSTILDKYDAVRLMSIMNKIRWYLNDGVKKSLNRKSKSILAQQVRLAYEYTKNKEFGE